MLWVIKVESKRWYYKFCEMLRVNLDLLQLLQNLMTALLINKTLQNNITLMSKHLVLDKLWFQAMDLSARSELTAESVSVK